MNSAYTPSQVAEYLAYIGLPESFHPSSKPTLDLEYLTTLFTHQLTAIPYENLLIHYSPQHAVSIDPQTIFTKIITTNLGRGGYCMETAILFNHMLRALGFPAYLVGARIRPRINNIPQGDVYTGWVHLVNIVTIPGSAAAAAGGVNYALDVGFGGDGMTVPMPLAEGVVHHNSIGTQEIRLVREFISNQRFRGEGARQWVYQVRNGGEGGPAEWVAFFAFHDGFEFTEEDFGVVNWYTSRAAESPQISTPLAIRFVRGKGADGRVRVVGKVMMVKGVVKENLTGKTRLVRECKTEGERVEALRELFGICLTEEEALSIRGLATELVGEA